MDYKKIYSEFIEARRLIEHITKKDYYENHHIVPKSLGGSNDDKNMIALSASDHLFAHKLLALIYGGPMWHAIHMCNITESSARGIRLSRRWYELSRKERAIHMSKTMSGKNHHFFGKKFSEEHIKNLSESHKGKFSGKFNPLYDHGIYDFRHKDGRHIRSTKGDFIKNNPQIPSRSIYAICSGSKKSAHGWYVSEKEICKDKISGCGSNHAWFNPNKYKFVHESGVEVVATQYEFLNDRPELSQSHVSGLCRGSRKSHKGWRVVQ